MKYRVESKTLNHLKKWVRALRKYQVRAKKYVLYFEKKTFSHWESRQIQWLATVHSQRSAAEIHPSVAIYYPNILLVHSKVVASFTDYSIAFFKFSDCYLYCDIYRNGR